MSSLKNKIPFFACIGLFGYGFFYFSGRSAEADLFALPFLVLGTVPLLWDMLKSLAKGWFGVDLIALVAIITSLALHQYFAGTVILLMLSGGEALEDYALRRSRKELTDLIQRAPRSAHLVSSDTIVDVPLEEVRAGQTVLVKPGETIPVDGVVTKGVSTVDQSALTGESLPVEVSASSRVLSGTINQNNPLEVRAVRESRDSAYEQILRLVRKAQEHKAPIVRLADRYAAVFTLITFVLALVAWVVSKNPQRVLAVLVVATPCPLILATPIAIVSGISRAARRGIIVKDGGALEQLAGAQAFVFDKTGTVTLGKPEVIALRAYRGNETALLSAAASLDQLSAHILAKSLVQHAKLAGSILELPEDYREDFGRGVSGLLARNGACERYFFGKVSYLQANGVDVPKNIAEEHEQYKNQGAIDVYLGGTGGVIGVVVFEDVVRPESRKVFDAMRQAGIRKIALLTGDKAETAKRIAEVIGVHEVYAEALPETKVTTIKDLQHRNFSPVVMVGDGVNDAAALAAADVGVAMGAHAQTATSEVSDVLITVDDLRKLPEAYLIAKRSIHIALQGILAGMVLSVVMMVFAVAGRIKVVPGAVLQEILDVLVIFNTLRNAPSKIPDENPHQS